MAVVLAKVIKGVEVMAEEYVGVDRRMGMDTVLLVFGFVAAIGLCGVMTAMLQGLEIARR